MGPNPPLPHGKNVERVTHRRGLSPSGQWSHQGLRLQGVLGTLPAMGGDRESQKSRGGHRRPSKATSLNKEIIRTLEIRKKGY